MIMNTEETKKVIAGGLSGTLISAITKVFSTIFEFGRALGSSLRRIRDKKSCSL